MDLLIGACTEPTEPENFTSNVYLKNVTDRPMKYCPVITLRAVLRPLTCCYLY
jgi:hypothetical protein